MLHSYLPFVAVLGGLYVASGGILLRGGPGGRPWGNTVMLALGVVLALVMGTAGAALVIIQPLLRGNAHRRRRFHLVLFLILLVGNTAGVLTPIGNPPLLVGLLRGVPFLWPARNLIWVWLLAAGLLLAVFCAIDWLLARTEPPPPPPQAFSVRGWANILSGPDHGRERHHPRVAGAARHRGGRPLALDHPDRDPPGERFLLAPDDRSGGVVRGHLHHVGAGVRVAAAGT